jgi:hypothetical protein
MGLQPFAFGRWQDHLYTGQTVPRGPAFRSNCSAPNGDGVRIPLHGTPRKDPGMMETGVP